MSRRYLTEIKKRMPYLLTMTYNRNKGKKKRKNGQASLPKKKAKITQMIFWEKKECLIQSNKFQGENVRYVKAKVNMTGGDMEPET